MDFFKSQFTNCNQFPPTQARVTSVQRSHAPKKKTSCSKPAASLTVWPLIILPGDAGAGSALYTSPVCGCRSQRWAPAWLLGKAEGRRLSQEAGQQDTCNEGTGPGWGPRKDLPSSPLKHNVAEEILLRHQINVSGHKASRHEVCRVP